MARDIKMNKYFIKIADSQLNFEDIKKYWVNGESAEEKKKRNFYAQNNYLGSMFSWLIAGLVSAWLARSKSPKYLHIQTNKNIDYCFSEDEININDTLIELKAIGREIKESKQHPQ